MTDKKEKNKEESKSRVHPRNSLNDLSGAEWEIFFKDGY